MHHSRPQRPRYFWSAPRIGPTPEVRDSRTSRHSTHSQGHSNKSDWLKMRNDYSAHAPKVAPSQRSRSLVLTKRSVASRNENELAPVCVKIECQVIYQTRGTVFHRDIQTPRRELKIQRAAEYF